MNLTTHGLAIAVGIVFAVTMAGCSYGPKGMSLGAYRAMKKTVSTIETLNVHRHDGVLIYAPLYVEAEKSISELAAVAERELDRNARFQSLGCIKEIEDAREHPDIEEYGHVSDLCVSGLYEYLR
jgi:hypothetical protein